MPFPSERMAAKAYCPAVRTLIVRTAALVSVTAAILADLACSGTPAVQGSATAPVIPVFTAKAKMSDVPIEVRVPAIVEPHLTVTVKAEVAGQLKRVLAREGQLVQRGEVLFEVEPEPYIAALNQAKAQLQRDSAQVELAQANLAHDRAQAMNSRREAERYSRLANEGVISREQQDQFSTNAEMAEQSVAADQAAVSVANAAVAVDRAAMERARVDLEHCTIRSPIDGVAGYLAIHEGNIIKGNADSALITLNEIAPAYVSFAVPDRYLDELRRRLVAGALPLHIYQPGTNRELSRGAANLIDNAVDHTTGTIHVKGLVANKDHQLWPAESVEASLTLRTERGVVTIPKAAVQQGEQGWYAFAVGTDHTADLRLIKIGAETGANVVVLEGIRPEEEVVTDGQLRLRPGARVNIASEQTVQMHEAAQ